MITIQLNHLIIDLEHPEPEELLKDLQNALFASLRLLSADATSDASLLVGRELCDASFAMIELLQTIVGNREIPK